MKITTMKKFLLTSILSLFLLGGLGVSLSATEVPEKDKDKKAACCKTGEEGVKAADVEKLESRAKCADRAEKKSGCKDKDKKEAAGCKDKRPEHKDKKAKPETPPAN